MSLRNFTLLLFVSVLGALAHSSVAAQSKIMNSPSTDVVAAKKVYVEMDFLTNYAWQRRDSFQNYIPRAVVGLARNFEVGANVSFIHVSGRQLPIEVQPNVKWQFYSNEGAHTAAAVGCILYAPITHRAGTDTLGQCYVVGSKRVSGRFGPRFTGGGFALLGAGVDQQTKGGAIAAYEQPLAKRVSFRVSGHFDFYFKNPRAPSTYRLVSDRVDFLGKTRQRCRRTARKMLRSP